MWAQAESIDNPFDVAARNGQLRDNPNLVYQWFREQSPICWSQR